MLIVLYGAYGSIYKFGCLRLYRLIVETYLRDYLKPLPTKN
jgi:hypothetical protein